MRWPTDLGARLLVIVVAFPAAGVVIAVFFISGPSTWRGWLSAALTTTVSCLAAYSTTELILLRYKVASADVDACADGKHRRGDKHCKNDGVSTT